jgi:hypothetical protein
VSRFPALKSIALILKFFAVLAVAGGIVGAVEQDGLLLRLGALAGGLLSALLLWAFSELISVALAIEANTYQAQRALTHANTVAWTPASSRRPVSSPDAHDFGRSASG